MSGTTCIPRLKPALRGVWYVVCSSLSVRISRVNNVSLLLFDFHLLKVIMLEIGIFKGCDSKISNEDRTHGTKKKNEQTNERTNNYYHNARKNPLNTTKRQRKRQNKNTTIRQRKGQNEHNNKTTKRTNHEHCNKTTEMTKHEHKNKITKRTKRTQ